MSKHTPGPWIFGQNKFQKNSGQYDIGLSVSDTEAGGISGCRRGTDDYFCVGGLCREADARLIAAAPEMLEALEEGRRAIGDHSAPSDCYATGPLTGDPIRDLVQCPACSFIAMYERALAKARGE